MSGKIDTNLRVQDGDYLISTQKACEVLDVSRQTLMNWHRNGLSKAARGWWSLEEIIRFRGLRGTDSLDMEDLSLMEQKLVAEIALKESQREMAKLKSDILAGRYIDAAVVDDDLKRLSVVLKRSLKVLAGVLLKKVKSRGLPRDAVQEAERMIEKTMSDARDVIEQMNVDNMKNLCI